MGIFSVFRRKTKELTEDKTNLELIEECEIEIYNEKVEHGRVSTMKMRYLRDKYGTTRANRAMWRLQKAMIKKDDKLSQIAMKVLGNFLETRMERKYSDDENNSNNNDNYN